MQKIRIMTDSAADIPEQLAAELDIQIIPFPVTFGDRTYISGVDFDTMGFYSLLESSPTIPTTAQITVFQYLETFEKAWQEGYTDLINVTINSEGSGTYNSACLAERMFNEAHPEVTGFAVHNLDGASYNCGYGYAVVHGAELLREGKPVEEILAFMKDWLAHSVVYFAPYTLKYAAKSGRIPSAAAFVGELVGLKAVMRIYDHRIVTDDKVRGEKKLIPLMKGKALKDMADGSPYVVICGSHPEDGTAMAAVLTEALGYPPAYISQVGAAVAINAGPRVVGVGFRGKE